jgi:hypothetical protein
MNGDVSMTTTEVIVTGIVSVLSLLILAFFNWKNNHT